MKLSRCPVMTSPRERRPGGARAHLVAGPALEAAAGGGEFESRAALQRERDSCAA